jgi:hypothetical protein
MADPEHLKILKQGVTEWNQWRAKNRDVKPDLRGANLMSANLMGANLMGVDLSGAVLNDAALNRARLISTSLNEAIITGAKLYGTARDDWHIDGIKCDYVFWDSEARNRTPKDRNFAPPPVSEFMSQK